MLVHRDSKGRGGGYQDVAKCAEALRLVQAGH